MQKKKSVRKAYQIKNNYFIAREGNAGLRILKGYRCSTIKLPPYVFQVELPLFADIR